MEFENLKSFQPIDCISSKVMRISRLTANIFRKHLSPFNITNSQLSLMFVLSKSGPLAQKQLSGIVILEKSSLNRNLNRLLDRNYLSKEEFPLIEITTEGMKFVSQIIPAWEKAMEEIRQVLGDEGEESLNTVLSRLSNQEK